MRIAFVSRRFFPAISGMSVYAANLLAQLVRRGHDVVLVSQYRGDAAGTAVYGGGPPPPVPGVEVVGLEALGEQVEGPADFEADVGRMVTAVEARAPFDVLHAQYGYPTGLAVLEAGRRLGVPTAVSVQGGDGHWVGPCCATHRAAMTTVLACAGEVLIGSRSFAEEVRDNLGTPLDRFTIVPGGTDPDAFSPSPSPSLAGTPGRTPGSLADPPVLLFHGRVDARKGVLELLDAVAALVDGGRRLRLVVSGIGPDAAAVAERVVELGLERVVEQSGYADHHDAPAVYRRGDVFVSPTWSEGFSNTILEAMASGLPVVTTRTVGVVDCVRDGENGLLVEPHDVAGLAAALGRLLDDGALRRRLASAALGEVRARWSWAAVADGVEAAYRRLAATAPAVDWPPLHELGQPADPACRFRSAPHLL